MESEQAASENLVLVYINSSRICALVHPNTRGGERRYEEAERTAGASGLKRKRERKCSSITICGDYFFFA